MNAAAEPADADAAANAGVGRAAWLIVALAFAASLVLLWLLTKEPLVVGGFGGVGSISAVFF